MSTLQVANLHFESTGNNRLQYTGSNAYNLVAGGVTVATINTTSVNYPLALTVNTFSTNTLTINGNAVATNNDILGQQTIWVPASAMYPRATAGAAQGTIVTPTNSLNIKTLDFDTATYEHALFAIQMPKSWNEGSLVFQFVWTHGATTTNFGVVWVIRSTAFANDDALDVLLGGDVSIADTGGTTNDVYITSETSAHTVPGSPAAEELVLFEIYRDYPNGSDTMAVDARLIGVKIHYTIDAAKDD